MREITNLQAETACKDPLRRLTPTPYAADLRIMGRTVRLETNSQTVLRQTRRVFEHYRWTPSGHPEFFWRIVTEADSNITPPWPEISAFSDEGLRFVSIGPRGFLAIDLEAREAVGFLSEELVKDKPGFTCVVLATLFDMTAGALRLTQISAACVAMVGKGLLIFGPPRSGKTISTYFAGKLGLEFHADQVTFLEHKEDGLHAWGQFWPAAFREETKQFLPELLSSTHPFTYGHQSFLCLENNPFQPAEARSVIPASCIFLERQAAEMPQLIPLPAGQLAERVKKSLPFKDDERFEPQRATVCRSLGKLPAYRLAYGDDPAVAAIFFRSLLTTYNLLEARA